MNSKKKINMLYLMWNSKEDIMLELKNICKSYKTGDYYQKALHNVNLKFRENEFVAILGPSGSGKTTLLNIIGGLDRYDTGDLIINDVSTKEFKDSTWDAYRNNSVGFIFQSYNLISHISILENVEMGMTLSGVNASIRKEKAVEALRSVGLEKHINKKPNQLSGGQTQRVAIARALVTDPDLILADEPSGALDSNTSIQIMELIKKISKKKLVIMVTHNEELANTYASRVIRLKDGEIISDSNPFKEEEQSDSNYQIRKTSMSFFTALKLSFKNIITKKGRTLLTAFASSIGIIGIALILSLSNGFNIEVDKFEENTLSSMPIMISSTSVSMDEETVNKLMDTNKSDENTFTSKKEIYPMEDYKETLTHKNTFNQEYIDYVENLDKTLVNGIGYTRYTNLNIITKKNGVYAPLGLSMLEFVSIPKKLDSSDINGVLEDNYDLLYGRLPKNKEELVLVVDKNNRISKKILMALGLDATKDKLDFNEIEKINLKLVFNDDYYKKMGNFYTVNTDFEKLYNMENNLNLKMVGIIRCKEEKKQILGSSYGLSYTNDLLDYVIEVNSKSSVVKTQSELNYNVLSGQPFEEGEDSTNTKEIMMSYLGGSSIPVIINIYPKNFDAKDKILNYLDDYNKNLNEEDKIIYTDLGALISSMSSSIMDAITIVLIAFSSISLVVAVIMIGIITYISVLERTKEIGILRALGARKKDIARVFNAETFIIGTVSGLLGIFIARILVFPTNKIILDATGLDNVAKMNPLHALLLIIISVTLTVIGGSIPAHMASKKDPVIALRTE